MLKIKDYYTAENRFLTSSKLKDWFKDKKMFYDKHILHLNPGKPTDSMLYGSLADYYLSGRIDLYEAQKERLMTRELKDLESTLKKVVKHKAYRLIIGEEYVSQDVLQLEMPIGVFTGLAGIPDWYKLSADGRNCHIVDLKTTMAINSIDYRYQCFKYGYYTQQAFYQILLKLLHPEITEFKSDHLVVYKKYKGNKIDFKTLEQDLIDKEKIKIWNAIEELKNEYKFDRYQSPWNFINTKKT